MNEKIKVLISGFRIYGRLNELTTFTVGKSFKFLDKQGNIYEATLKKIGNINNKK